MIDDGSNFLSGLDFTVTDKAHQIGDVTGGLTSSGGGGAPPAGGFAMSQDGMLILLNKAKSTQKLISQQIGAAQPIAEISPPGHDVSSVEFTNTAMDSGSSYLKHLRIQFNRYTALIEKLNKALGITVETDQQNADAAKRANADSGPKY